jgi:tartrate dehydratase beta subunit/fumarate hydratase class I family protein
MSKYISNKQIEAIQFLVSDEQLEEVLKSGERISIANGFIEVRRSGDKSVSGLVKSNGEHKPVDLEDYLIVENGRVAAIMNKNEFEAEYSAVVEPVAAEDGEAAE